MCFYQTPGRRPPRITGRFVNTVTRGWVGPPKERARLRFHGAVVDFVDVCRGPGISPLRINIWLSFSQADHGPTFAILFFSGLVQGCPRHLSISCTVEYVTVSCDRGVARLRFRGNRPPRVT